MRRVRSRDEWQQIIDEFKVSGKSQKEFVASRGLNLSSFHYWFYRDKKNHPLGNAPMSAVNFLPVHLKTVSPTNSQPNYRDSESYYLAFGQLRLHFNRGADACYVAELAQALMHRC